MTGSSPEPGSLEGYAPIEGDDDHLLLLETQDVVDKFTLWEEGYLDFNELSERDQQRAQRYLAGGKVED